MNGKRQQALAIIVELLRVLMEVDSFANMFIGAGVHESSLVDSRAAAILHRMTWWDQPQLIIDYLDELIDDVDQKLVRASAGDLPEITEHYVRQISRARELHGHAAAIIVQS